MKSVVLLAAVLCLAACVSNSRKSYQPVAVHGHFVLERNLAVATRVSSEFAAGTYTAAFSKNGTTFYMGPPGAIILPIGAHTNGGVAIVEGSPRSCYVFFEIGGDPKAVGENYGFLVGAMSSMERGRIREFPDDPGCATLLPQIRIVQDAG